MAVALLGRVWAWEWGRRVRELSLEVSAQAESTGEWDEVGDCPEHV